MRGSIDYKRKKIIELEAEIKQLKKSKMVDIEQQIKDNIKDMFTDNDRINGFITIMSKELSTAIIKIAPQKQHVYEYDNLVVFSIQTNLFGIQLKGKKDWRAMRLEPIGSNNSFYDWSQTQSEQEIQTKLENIVEYPLATIISTLLDWNPKDDMLYYMPIYAQVFWGMVKACLYAHITFSRQQDKDVIRIEDIKKYFP